MSTWDNDKRPGVRLDERLLDRPGAYQPLRGHIVHSAPRLILSMASRPNLAGALCAKEDPNMMFASGRQGKGRAKALCGRCPVQEACLEAAMDRRERWGIWGGVDFSLRTVLTSYERSGSVAIEATPDVA